MPLVKIELFEGRTQAQKKAIAEGIAEVFHDVLGSHPEHNWIIFQDRARSDWFTGGNSQTEIDESRKSADT
ncbi:4-oxalocrotonate tautomerase family protein [uncultured Tateyamaria sp.]|uniref:tautomerase family protein n=1 Tax=uncultured Tateyamaria sp. TaxID=455651 RepID=UPI002624BA0E|nr:4-oxalocrotonate tautomerase family protein [uncultured Tateyamaria sp.]